MNFVHPRWSNFVNIGSAEPLDGCVGNGLSNTRQIYCPRTPRDLLFHVCSFFKGGLELDSQMKTADGFHVFVGDLKNFLFQLATEYREYGEWTER